MLIIRDAQLVAFHEPLERAFVEGTIASLRADAAEVVGDASPEELEDLVRHGIARARAHALSTEYQIAQYVTFMTWLGRDFDTDPSLPWARAILVDPSQDGDEKVAAIEEYVMSAWQGAR